ncbi:tetratricopeptide repeat protein [Petrachloros mirabilis]
MISSRPLSSRLSISLILAIVCLSVSACASNQPVEDLAAKMRAEDEAAAREVLKSAEGGDVSAQNEMGRLYYEGKGVPQNYRQAKQWFEKAAKKGDAAAQVNLGMLYLHGDGAPQSAQMALFWFRQAAEQDNAAGLGKLGLMHEQGRGVLQDFIQAHKWYNLSAARGEESSAAAREALATRMTPAQIAEAQRLAREWRPKEVKSAKAIP